MPNRRLANDNESAPVLTSIFKRNRTITGVLSSPESPRIHVHYLSIKRRKLFSILLVTVVAIVLLWALISNFTATVSIGVSDSSISKTIDSKKYQSVIQNYLIENPLSRFRFLLDQTNLNMYVKSKLPEVESVVQKTMVMIGVTDFTVTMRTPVAGWKINNKQYYVDASGVSFDQNYFSAPLVQIIDNSGAPIQPGEASVSRRFLGFVGLVVSIAKSSGYTVTQAILPLNMTRELDIKLKESDLLVKMSIDRSAGEQVEDMGRAVKYFAETSQTPTYIDVRASGKVFFK